MGVVRIALVLTVVFAAAAAEDSTAYRVLKDIPYAEAGGRTLALDLYLPTGAEPGPLLVWIHGGAWRSGSKDKMPLLPLVEAGYAAASVEYRLSPEVRFPAQVHDCKAAIRFLRAHAAEYGYDARLVAVAGSSAGGHLAALIGVSNGVEALEGELGNDLGESSSVQAIVDFFGPTNFATILTQSTPHGLSVRVPALELLLGGQPDALPELAKLASPVAHVDAGDPPLLMLHGDQDPQVPINQSHELEGKYTALGLDVRFVVVHGAAHGGKAFFDAERLGMVGEFLDAHLRGGE